MFYHKNCCHLLDTLGARKIYVVSVFLELAFSHTANLRYHEEFLPSFQQNMKTSGQCSKSAYSMFWLKW